MDTPHDKLRQIEADIKELEEAKNEIEVKYNKWPTHSHRIQLERINASLERQQQNKREVLDQIQYSLF